MNTEDNKIKALAKFLDISVDNIENDYEDTYTVNPSKKLTGNSPKYYMDSCNEFKLLIGNKNVIALTKAILSLTKMRLSASKIENVTKKMIALDKIEAKMGKIYTKFEAVTPKEPVVKDWLYNVNILYWLLNTSESYKHTHEDMVSAWTGNTPVDRRVLEDSCEGEYMVLTDDEADQKASEYIDGTIDDMLPRGFMGSGFANYFDREGYIENVINSDGRGGILSSYDGEENEIKAEGTTYYIYRTN